MTLQEMINYEKRASYEEGLDQGILNGIQGIIHLCKSQDLGLDLAQNTLMKQYSLTKAKTDEYINLYW